MPQPGQSRGTEVWSPQIEGRVDKEASPGFVVLLEHSCTHLFTHCLAVFTREPRIEWLWQCGPQGTGVHCLVLSGKSWPAPVLKYSDSRV